MMLIAVFVFQLVICFVLFSTVGKLNEIRELLRMIASKMHGLEIPHDLIWLESHRRSN